MEKQNPSLELRLSNALFSLLNDKDYEQITITDITKKTKVARTTFYICFDNKDELLRFSINRYMIPFVAGLRNSLDLKPKDNMTRTIAALSDIAPQIKFLPLLLSIKTATFNPSREIENSVKKEIRQILQKQQIDPAILEYFASLYFVSLLETQKWWAQHPKVAPAKVAQLIHQSCYHGLISLLN